MVVRTISFSLPRLFVRNDSIFLFSKIVLISVFSKQLTFSLAKSLCTIWVRVDVSSRPAKMSDSSS
jgi:hypothetical protein